MTASTRRDSAASPVITPPPGAPVPEFALDIEQATARSEARTGDCFGCGDNAPNGLRMRRTSAENGIATAEIFLTEGHQGGPGLAHGGILAAAMDEVTGTAAWLLGGRYVTGRLETDYLLPVPVGTTLFLRAWPTGIDGRKAYVEGEARIGAPDGPLAVRAAALFIDVPLEHFTKQR